MADKKKLNPKQERFCQEYMKDMNATQAYIRAGYAPTKAAEVCSCKLLKIAKVKARIAELSAEATKRNELTVDDVIGVWKNVIRDDEENSPNKLIAARDAGKYFGLFIEKKEVEHTGKVEIAMVNLDDL